jgi:Holliday junction resolvase
MHHLQEEKEADVQRAILEYLTLKGIFHYRNNSGAFVFPQTATTSRRFFKAGALGSPDIVCVVNGQYVGIEVKGTRGKQSDNQKEFQRRLEEAGGRYILAYSLDDVVSALHKVA